MKRYYTRACNFYYGKESITLVNKKKSLPLNGIKNISFDRVQIISRKLKKKIFIKDLDKISKQRLETLLIKALSSFKTPSIVLRTEKKVAIDQVVYVMNIANKNGIKVVLAVDST